MKIGDHIKGKSGSRHPGISGIITGDYGFTWEIKVDDEKYRHAYKSQVRKPNTTEMREGKYLMLDKERVLMKDLKCQKK
jgi:hypothetical protein